MLSLLLLVALAGPVLANIPTIGRLSQTTTTKLHPMKSSRNVDMPQHERYSINSSFSTSSLTAYLCLIRGGHVDENSLLECSGMGERGDEGNSDDEADDDYDEEDINDAEEDDATAMHQQRRNLQRDQASKQPQQPGGRRPAPYIPRKKKKKNLATRIAQSSLSLSKKAVGTTVKSSGKAAFYLMRPKSIQESELWGVWRLDQQVGMKQSTANIELTKHGFVILRAGEKIVWKAPYRFVTPAWPKMPRVEFEARAFQPNNKGGGEGKAWVLFYKGSLERKVADKSVIKMVGKLYEIERPKGMFGKELPVRYNKIGSFVGRRRIVIQEDDDDEYDDEEFSGAECDVGEQSDADGDYDDYDEEDV